MSDALVGSSNLREVYLEELGAPVTGATLLYDLNDPRGVSVLTGATVSEQGSGWYQVALTGAQVALAGLYVGRWYGTAGSGTISRPDGFLARHPGPLQLQRWELRHHVADLCDDLHLGVATGGSATTLVDTRRQEAHWRGWWAYVYGGQGRGDEQWISASDSTGVLTTTAWVTPPTAGSRYELHRLKRVEDYNRAINLAVLQSGKRATLRVEDESVLLTTDVFEYALPAGLVLVSEVWTRDITASPSEWARLERLPRGGWELLPGRVLRIAEPATNLRLRLVGQMLPDVLNADTSYVDTHPEYLAFKAAAHVLGSKITGQQVDRDAMAQRANYYQEQAQRLEPKIRPMRNAVRV